MNSKHFFTSKINWAAIALILVAIIPIIDGLDVTTMGVKEWITFGLGVIVIVLRTYFTSTTIKKPRTKKK